MINVLNPVNADLDGLNRRKFEELVDRAYQKIPEQFQIKSITW
jgi:hypothetical protein